MRDQYKVINISDRSFASKRRRVTCHVVRDVHQEKRKRKAQADFHKLLMKTSLAVFDGDDSPNENQSCNAINGRIQRRQKGEIIARDFYAEQDRYRERENDG